MTFSLFFFCVCHFQTVCHSLLLVIHSCLSFRSEAEESASSLALACFRRCLSSPLSVLAVILSEAAHSLIVSG